MDITQMNRFDFADFLVLFFICFSLNLFSSNANATTVPLDLGGDLLLHSNGSITIKSPTTAALVDSLSSPTKVAIPKVAIDIPTSQGLKRAEIKAVGMAVNSAKIGGAALRIARSLTGGPIGVAVGVGLIICDVTDICQFPDPNDPSKTITQKVTQGQQNWKGQRLQTYSTPHEACEELSNEDHIYGYLYVTFVNPTYYDCHYTIAGSGDYVGMNTVLMSTSDSTKAPPTVLDWANAEQKMDTVEHSYANQNVMAHFVADNKGDLPVLPTDYEPQVVSLPDLTNVVRNGDGTIIGTEHESTTIDIRPDPTVPNAAQTTETITKTTTDANGNPTGSTTTTKGNDSSTQEPKKEWPTIEIDDVPPVELPAYTMPATFTHSSFGESTCPPDPVVPLSVGSKTIPVHVICQYMTGVRVVVILLSLLAAAAIISGIKYD